MNPLNLASLSHTMCSSGYRISKENLSIFDAVVSDKYFIYKDGTL